MIVLDTNVLSELQGRRHSERILHWLDSYKVDEIFLTTIVVAEIQYGLALLEEGQRKRSLQGDFARMEAEFTGRILGFSVQAAYDYAAIAATRKRQGHPIETKDAMIAATCRAHGATLATRNTKDFEGLDLKLVNPFENG